jgi:hypothetical protein
MSWRTTILDAVSEALRLHRHLGSQEKVEKAGGGVDIFGAIIERSVPLIFRPLDHLLGAYVPKPFAGIIVTTERSLAVQRFTASHELGHLTLGHGGSVDDATILDRSPFGGTRYSVAEAAADAFASSFLAPEWLLEFHAIRQGWDADSFTNPRTVYQLSLRIGASYQATCHALGRYNVITRAKLGDLLSIPPRKIKQELLVGHPQPDWHRDVWVLSERDQGMLVQGGPTDVFLIRLKEDSGAGYLWNVEDVRAAGFSIVADEVSIRDGYEEIGGSVERLLVARSESEAAGKLDVRQVRPWETRSTDVAHFSVNYDLFGRENGLPRAQRVGEAAA